MGSHRCFWSQSRMPTIAVEKSSPDKRIVTVRIDPPVECAGNTEAFGRFPPEPDLLNLDEHLVRCQARSGGYEETPPTCLPGPLDQPHTVSDGMERGLDNKLGAGPLMPALLAQVTRSRNRLSSVLVH